MNGSSGSSPGRAAALIVAGGSGARFGGPTPKQFVLLGGEPVLLHSLRPFLAHPGISSIVVVLPESDSADPPHWLGDHAVQVVAGGAQRTDSVRAGLAALPGEIEVVLVHDAARPLVTTELVSRVLAAAPTGGAIPGLPVADTLKRVDRQGSVVETVDRSDLWVVQTPQGFPRSVLQAAHAAAERDGAGGTDDAALVERLGYQVRIVPGDPRNLKLTMPADLVVAEALLRAGSLG